MICYRDMTYCDYADCADLKCSRRLTDTVEKDAKLLRLPICQYAEKPDCFKEPKNIGIDMKITAGTIDTSNLTVDKFSYKDLKL